MGQNISAQVTASDAINEVKKRKRKSKKLELIEVADAFRDPGLDMSTSPEAPKMAVKRKTKKSRSSASPELSRKTSIKKIRNSKDSTSPARSRKKVSIVEPSPPPKLLRGKACIRCREKRIKCNEGKPACNQCKRGLWACQYEVVGGPKRSETGCLNCKQRKRKCTEEQPSCAHCSRLDDDCEYADYS